jgi:hypothetical protein
LIIINNTRCYTMRTFMSALLSFIVLVAASGALAGA